MKEIIIPLKKAPSAPSVKNIKNYAIVARRGPSVGKSAWKPGGSAHKTFEVSLFRPGMSPMRWNVDAVTGKRVSQVRHDVAMMNHIHAERIEGMIRRLAWKATHGGLTALEFDKLSLLAMDESVHGNVALLRLIDTVLIKPSNRGHVVTCRNVPKVIKAGRTTLRYR